MLTELLSTVVAANPNKTAIVQGARRVRYNELDELVGRSASGLQQLGINAGDCVAVVLPNCPEFVAMLFACARLRAVMLPLNPQYTREELLHYVIDARAKVAIVDARRRSAIAGTDLIVAEFGSLLRDTADSMPADSFSGRALYLYTSGSTDTGKRLCCTQNNLLYEARNFVETAGLTATDNILCTIPLYHSYGLGNCLLDSVYTGSTLVLMEHSDAPFVAQAERVLELIRHEEITFYPGVPFQFQILTELPDRSPEALPSVRLCVSSGDVLPRHTYERFLKRFGVPIRSLYGSTEAGSISMNTEPVESVRFGTLGPPLKNVEIRIRDEFGRDLAPNESGSIWVKSPVIPPTGYENRPELTALVFRDGCYNTGDLGMVDDRGHLVLTGRKQTFVDVGGHKVDLSEVEEILQRHPGVREAAAVGVEVPNLGTHIKAVVVTGGNCHESEILAHCRRQMAAFKVPRLVEFRDVLPRSPIGKVLKSELVDTGAYFAKSHSVNSVQGFPTWDLLAAEIQEQSAHCLQCDAKLLARSASFQSLGFDSLRAAELHLRLVELTGLPLSITVLWNYPSINELATALWTQMNAKVNNVSQADSKPVPISRRETEIEGLISATVGLSDSEIEASFRAG